MKRSLLALLLSFVTAGLIISQGTITSVTATGNSSGHIGNIVIQNITNNPIKFTIPAAAIPSDGQTQGYILPKPIPVTVPGKTTTTVPLQGYCTDVDLPAPTPGAVLPPVDTWNPNSPLLNPISDIIRTTTNLQGSGVITTPFSGNPQQELVTVVQQIFWLTISTPDKPYTAADLCDRIRRQFQNNSGTPATGMLPDLNHGIAQILDAVTKVGRAAGISTFMPPALPPAASQLTDAPPSSQPLVTNTIRATGTGRTTGNIANITLNNPTDQAIKVQFGPSPTAANALFIPSEGKYQPYIVPYLPAVTLAPGASSNIPVQGFCTDIRLPPVPDGVEMPPISSWISSAPPVAPEHVNPPGGMEPATVVVPTRTGLPLDQAVTILEGLPTIPALSGVDCQEGLLAPTPTIPGTDIPITTPVNPDQHPGLATPLLLDAINRISQAYDELKPKGAISTPFSGNPEKEREAVIQQTFWRYNAALRGEPYEKKDFQDNTVRQFEQNSGKKYADIPKPQQEKMDMGVDDFWNTFEAVGAEAKVLKRPVPKPEVPAEFPPLLKLYTPNTPAVNADIPPPEKDDTPPPPPEKVADCAYNTDVIFNPELDFEMKISENWDDKADKETVIAEVKRALEQGLDMSKEQAFVNYDISNHPTSATAFWKINHIGGFGSAYARQRFKKADGSTEYVSETENLSVSAEGANEFFMEFEHDPECKSIVIGTSLSRLQAKGKVFDAVAGNDKNSLKVLRLYVWAGKKAIEFLLARGVTKGLVGGSKVDAIAAFLTFLKDQAPDEFKDMTNEDFSETVGEAFESLLSSLGIDPTAEIPAYLEEKLKILSRANEAVDAAFDLMFYSSTFATAFGGMNITVGNKTGTLIAQTRKFYLRKSLEDSKEAVSGTSDQCTELILTDALPNRLDIKTWGLSSITCQAEGNGRAETTLESMHYELLLGICICPNLKPLVVKAALNGWYSINKIDPKVAENLESEAKAHIQKKIDSGALNGGSTNQAWADALHQFMENWAKQNRSGWADCTTTSDQSTQKGDKKN